jgi:hypothetical protein
MDEARSQEVTLRRFRLLSVVCAVTCLFLAVRYALFAATVVSRGTHHTAIGYALASSLSLLCALAAVMLIRDCSHARAVIGFFDKRTTAVVWALYALIALPALIFSVPEGWDEARHILYGMYLRGYSISSDSLAGMVVRSPMASLLSALVFPFTQVINPVLLAALVAVMLAWCRRYSHPAMMLFILPLFVMNDHFLQAIWAVMGELPGALFLVAAMHLLARERFAACAVCLGFAVLSRWNLAPFALVAVLFVALRVSLRQAGVMAAIGAVIFAAWCAKTWIVAGPPLDMLKIYASNAHAYVDASGPLPGVRPTALGRLTFYGAATYFQTLPALAAIFVSFFLPRAHLPRIAGDLLRYWIPASLFIYFLCITLTGGFYPRLAVVTFPLTLLLFAEVIWSARIYCVIPPRMLLPVMLLLLPLAAATGVERYDVAEMIGRKILQPPPLPDAVVLEIRRSTTRRDIIVMPKFYKVTRHSDGRHLRVHTRRDFRFFADPGNPPIEKIISRSLDDEIRDFEPHVEEFLAAVPQGMFFLLPAQYKDRIDQQSILFEEEGWILGKIDR